MGCGKKAPLKFACTLFPYQFITRGIYFGPFTLHVVTTTHHHKLTLVLILLITCRQCFSYHGFPRNKYLLSASFECVIITLVLRAKFHIVIQIFVLSNILHENQLQKFFANFPCEYFYMFKIMHIVFSTVHHTRIFYML